jgi:hypothetical protein
MVELLNALFCILFYNGTHVFIEPFLGDCGSRGMMTLGGDDAQPSLSPSFPPRLTDDFYFTTCFVIMAYQDPYAGQYGHQQQPYGQPQYGQQQYGRQQQYEYGQYNDPAPEFNPYAAPEQPHPTYEQGAYENYGGGYRDDPGQDHQYAPRRQATQPSFADAPAPLAPKSMDERSSFDHGEFTPSPRGPK